MNQTYTNESVLQAGKKLVDFLIGICNSANNISAFLKEYITLLSSEDGIYSRQEIALEKFAESSNRTKAEADTMIETSLQNTEALRMICNEFQQMNEKIFDAQKRRDALDEKVQGLNKRIKEISGFIQDIQEVSEQTNLLSFNASIEAARAGEAGRGFRIIANEVKNLSAQTKSLSIDIDAKMKELQKDVSEVVTENKTHNTFMDSFQMTARRSNEQLLKIQNDNRENTEFMNHVLSEMNENQQAVLSATKETEEKNLEQVEAITSRAAQNTIHTGDQLSFLFQLRKVFDWLEENASKQNLS